MGSHCSGWTKDSPPSQTGGPRAQLGVKCAMTPWVSAIMRQYHAGILGEFHLPAFITAWIRMAILTRS